MMTTLKDIASFIPIGHENAITRRRLSVLTGLGDRTVRELIAKARETSVILNLQDGNGYYRPDLMDPEDHAALRRYIFQENSRSGAILRTIAVAADALAAFDVADHSGCSEDRRTNND